MTISPQRRAQLKLQGQYIGHVKQLSLRNKMLVRSILAKKDVRAAVARAKQLMPKRAA
jgi:hypothetical protein